MRILCLKHVSFEGPALLAKWAYQHGHSLQVESSFETDTFPAIDEFDLLLIMGGPMNIYEEESHPWLAAEKDLIKQAIKAGKYLLGICLGAQLIADCLGAKVLQNDEKEIGWFPIQKTDTCPPFLDFPAELKVLHWHGDTFMLPENAIRLAESAACRNQAFLFEQRVLGLQFHIEMAREHVHLICAACSDELKHPTKFVQSSETIANEPDDSYQRAETALFSLMNSWLNEPHDSQSQTLQQ